MSQSQRKQAGWQHEIDELAHGDFHNYIAVTTRAIKKLRTVALIGWALSVFLVVALILEVIL